MNRKFKIISYLLNSYFQYLHRPIPLWTILYITRKCNLNCDYCLFSDNNRDDPALEQIFSILGKIKELGCNFVSITGGEPTLRKDLISIIEYCSKNKIISYLNTNGTLLTKEYIHELGEAGVDVINLSLDALNNYENSIKDIKHQGRTLDFLLEGRKKYGFELISNQVLTTQNIKQVKGLMNYLSERQVSITYCLKYPTNQDFKHEDAMKEFENVVDDILKKKKQGLKILSTVHYLKFIKRHVRYSLEWKCDAGNSFFVIDVDGKISICDRLAHLDIPIQELNRKNYPLIVKMARKEENFQTCSRKCLINCAFETSYFLKHPLKFIKHVIF